MLPLETLEREAAADYLPGRLTDENLPRNGLRLQPRGEMDDVSDWFALSHRDRAGADADSDFDVEAAHRRTDRYGGFTRLYAAIFLSHGKAKESEDAIALGILD